MENFHKKKIKILFAYSSRFEIFKDNKLYEELHLREVIDTFYYNKFKKCLLKYKNASEK